MRKFRWFAVTLLAVFSTLSLGWAQSPLPSGTQFKVELQQKLDSKKAKVGDKVTAKCSDNVKVSDQVVLAKGTLLQGIVTQATPAASGTPAAIGVLFSQAVPKRGPALAFRAAIDKVYVDYSNSSVSGFSRGPEMGGNSAAVNSAMAMDSGDPANASMDRASNGVPIGYSVQQTAAGQQSDLGGVITSTGANFNLDDGTHVRLRVLDPH